MPISAQRRSLVHHLLQGRCTRWGTLANAPIALRCGDENEEAAASRVLALCDASALPKLGVKGPGAEQWLRGQGAQVPAGIYDTCPLVDGGLIARSGSTDFFLEGGTRAGEFSRLSAALATPSPGVYRVVREDATFLLAGDRSTQILAHLCSLDFQTAQPRRLILTRAYGINCGILPDSADDLPCYRFWVGPTFAVSFWELLTEIIEELGGRVVGAACFYPELTERNEETER
jgi:hypothetical protein